MDCSRNWLDYSESNFPLSIDRAQRSLRGSQGHSGRNRTDPRIQVILIAFSFGAFFEGAAGFGTPVAVTAAILMQLGFKPLSAAGLSLIANTAPVAFGALGTPIIALEGVTGIDKLKLSAMVGRQLPFFSLIVPFWVVWAMAGFRGMLGDLARGAHSGGLFCSSAVSCVELPRPLAGRYRGFPLFHGGPRGAIEVLAADGFCRRFATSGSCAPGETRQLHDAAKIRRGMGAMDFTQRARIRVGYSRL